MMQHRALAHVENLRISFGDASPVVDGVNLSVFSGECVALVGESGSGKSLTAKSLLGLLPRTARVRSDTFEIVSADGAIRHAPATHSRMWADIRGRHASLVPQDALGALDPLRRIVHEVGDTLRLHRIANGRDRQQRVIAALLAAGMPDPESRLRLRSDELSGGLKQRALVASALIAEPSLIIADEPTTALDARHRGRLLDELRRRADSGCGVLLITHDLVSVRDIADRVMVMHDGIIIEEGAPERVLTHPDQPFTRELIAATPAGVPRGVRLLAGQADPFTPPRIPQRTAHTLPDAEPLTAPPKLSLDSITVTFGEHRVLSDAALDVRSHETVGLIGESGSGKTTLLRVALGLHAPDRGTVSIDGVDRATAGRATRDRMRRQIAFVPQDPLDSFPTGATGSQILVDALRAAGMPRDARRDESLRLADEVGLRAAELSRPAATLSGGQRQRLAIARALARGPELMLLDEPVSALDVTIQARVLDLLDDIQAARGTSYLLVSHDEAVIEHMSDRIMRLEDGRVREQ